jgi:ABC-type transport system involved in multi-copper enzyme maturation permease subunit
VLFSALDLASPEGPAMAFRGGLGPVFAFEWLTATRRWAMYAWRSAFVGMLLLGLTMVWAGYAGRVDLGEIKVQAEIGRQFYFSVVVIALVMVLLAAPAATAGTICLDKARGTLFHIFVTDLSDAEIVLGKLAARLVPVLGLIACTLPVLALMTLLGGVDPVALTGSFVVLVGMAFLGCALALTLSVWGKKTHEVLLATYFVWVVWNLLVPGASLVSWSVGAGMNPPSLITRFNPFVLALGGEDVSSAAGPALGDQLVFLGAAALFATALVALTVRRMRRVVVAEWGRVEASRPARFRPIPGPQLDPNPVLWREWHRRRPSRWARIIWGAYAGLALAMGAVAVYIASGNTGARADQIPALISGLQVAIGLLLLSVSSATSLCEERARGSLDVLLATPLSTASILWGMWWGAFRGVILVAIVPTAIAAAGVHADRWVGVPLVLGLVLAYGAAITSLGLALATWIERTGRVLALCVAIYVVASIGWVALVVMLRLVAKSFGLYCVMESPFYGVAFLTIAISETTGPQPFWPGSAIAAAVWIGINAAVAALLLAATWRTFDRCMGRIPDGPTGPAAVPPVRRSQEKLAVTILEEV